MVMQLFGGAYRGRRVLITGHTGFKGSWLALWLHILGARISGVALSPETSPNHWDLIRLDSSDHRLDIRDHEGLGKILSAEQPEIVFHLAAQPLVRRSYRQPIDTWSTNVIGTANLLEACRHAPSVSAIVVITTDKCYENRNFVWGYREIDRLGGHDPYSASKAATELLVASYRHSYFSDDNAPLIAAARAGNVIGGGDWSEDRLIPDLVRAMADGNSLELRSPAATRPWQHVLEPLAGYLMLGERLLAGRRDYADAWNFGPGQADHCAVHEVLTQMQTYWPTMRWHQTSEPQPHEAAVLHLSSEKAHQVLGWRPVWSLRQGLAATAAWYREFLEKGAVLSREQLEEYVRAAQQAGAAWSVS